MPATCDKLGLHFDYPENWEIESFEPEDELDEREQVVLSSPETAFWQLSRHPADAQIEPLFDEALAVLREEYNEIEASPGSHQIGDQTIQGFDANFYCLDFTNTCSLRAFKTAEATYLSIFQAEDREFQRLEPVLLAMLTSMFRSLPALS